ncbi:hypothetical protein RHS04_07897 [Rhizoctonia solani]|uniref:Uncharacterized protein n=1 Tax=Rhizoctonia solani TaxID=456999 RepID=A0A8H7H277_9AGAM|nr:hypothetical protein RHS04_07897 [Rhizoctonia solani]
MVSEIPEPCSTEQVKEHHHAVDTDRDRDIGTSILEAGLRYRETGQLPTTGCNPTKDSLGYFNRLWPQDQSQSIMHSFSSRSQPTYRQRPFDADFDAIFVQNSLFEEVKCAYQSIPPSLDAPEIRGDHFGCVARVYIFQTVGVWFLTPGPVRNFPTSKTMRRALSATYLGAMILQNLNQGLQDTDITSKKYIGWIDEFEEKLAASLRINPPLSHIGDCLVAYIEVNTLLDPKLISVNNTICQLSLLKLAIADGASVYATLRFALPKFLSLVATDAGLMIEQPNGNLAVSFFHTLSSTRQEIGRFVLCDVLIPFLFGLPPLVEYGYDAKCICDRFEWFHGIPIVFFQVISQVNSWRAGSRASSDDWQDLEQRIVSQEQPNAMSEAPRPSTLDGASVERATVKELWKHVALIYIYMGMCGASSHDSRVQASVDHIFHHAETLGTSRIGIHMLPHCWCGSSTGKTSGSHIQEADVVHRRAAVVLVRTTV